MTAAIAAPVCPSSPSTGPIRAARPSPRTVRVGAVSFTNTVPLIEGLTERSEPSDELDIQLRLTSPAELAELLHAGALDVGLIPVVEHFRAGDRYRFLTEVGICSRGPVDSVLVFCRKPASQVRTLLADRRSRTSVALAQVWFAKALGVGLTVTERFDPLVPTTPEPRGPGAATPADAVLVIGDAAWFVPRTGWAEIIDLGEAWQRLTGLGFVYAGWSARPELAEAQAVELSQRLLRAKTAGLAAIESLSASAAAVAGVPSEKVRRYWTQHIRFDIGEPERLGRELFRTWCAELGLL